MPISELRQVVQDEIAEYNHLFGKVEQQHAENFAANMLLGDRLVENQAYFFPGNVFPAFTAKTQLEKYAGAISLLNNRLGELEGSKETFEIT